MKNALIQHIKQIFDVLNINEDCFVYDSINDVLPDWLQKEKLTHEFVVCCDAEFEKERLERFIYKEIFQIGNKYFWFEGNVFDVANHEVSSNVDSMPIRPKEKLKVSTRLSSWLDNFIFGTLHAEYSPDFQKFEYNLNLRHEENQKYLGTYFPRSYAETFCIFDNLFCNETIFSKYSVLTEVSILSVGCGTGGDIIGLLTVINKHFTSIKTMNVVAIDGNEDALNILSEIVQQLERQFRKEVVLTTKHIVFDSIESINIMSSFDFIITSKMINEIINRGKGRMDNSYYEFAKSYAPLLNDNGIMMLLDVTTKVGVSDFCPILMNRQINQFVYEYPAYASIIPIPCFEKENCETQCFSQKEFTVTHSRCSNDKSRVAYRILVKKSFSKDLQLMQPDAKYQISTDRYCGQGSSTADGFFLPNKKIIQKRQIETPTEHSGEPYLAKETKVLKKTEEEQLFSPSEQLGEAYVIDTNAFIYAPNIIEKIAGDYPIFVSAKVVDELDHRKDVTSGNDKKKAQKALKSINMAISRNRVQTVTSDARLLPVDFDRRSSDNLILSVVLKVKKMGYTPILVTSDNGFQIKAKTLKIKTISYTKVKSKV